MRWRQQTGRRAGRCEAVRSAVLEAKLEAARERAVQAESVSAEMRTVAFRRDAVWGDKAKVDGAERRRSAPQKG